MLRQTNLRLLQGGAGRPSELKTTFANLEALFAKNRDRDIQHGLTVGAGRSDAQLFAHQVIHAKAKLQGATPTAELFKVGGSQRELVGRA